MLPASSSRRLLSVLSPRVSSLTQSNLVQRINEPSNRSLLRKNECSCYFSTSVGDAIGLVFEGEKPSRPCPISRQVKSTVRKRQKEYRKYKNKHITEHKREVKKFKREPTRAKKNGLKPGTVNNLLTDLQEKMQELGTGGWGEDNLVPNDKFVPKILSFPSEPPPSPQPIQKKKKLPNHIRRIEGMIEPIGKNKDVLTELDPPTGKARIATLAHGLDRTLFNPGVHWIQDPRSGVYNFTPFVQEVPDIKDFAFDRLPPFVPSSRDTVMRELALNQGKRFAGSTSSLTGLLSHIYYLMAPKCEFETSTLCSPFNEMKKKFTPGQLLPAAVVYDHKDGVYMINSDNKDDDDTQWNVLLWMGTMLEKFFTMPKPTFGKLLKSQTTEDTFKKEPEAYRYSKSDTFVLRSQLDCIDNRLPGTGVFDIKTRAAFPIRHDIMNFKENSGYQISSLHGRYFSFDREYYDLIRSAFLKYSFQVRIGNMDGVFVAYHNTSTVFGFQYIPLEEMDMCLYGNKTSGQRVFEKCIKLLEVISEEIVQCFPGQSVACLAESEDGEMNIWVQPVEESAKDTKELKGIQVQKQGQGQEEEEVPMVTSDAERPIVQLRVTVINYLNDEHTDGERAVRSNQPWTIHWSISRLSLPSSTIRASLNKAKERKIIPKGYPTGVDEDNLDEFVRNLGFGDVEGKSKTPLVDPKMFIQPTKGILTIRKMSRRKEKEGGAVEGVDGEKGVGGDEGGETEGERKIMWEQTKFDDPSYHMAFPRTPEDTTTSLAILESIGESTEATASDVPVDKTKPMQ